jgi:PKD repeat protein
MKVNAFAMIIIILLVGISGLTLPVSGAPLTWINNVSHIASPYGTVFINATVAKYSDTTLPAYYGTLSENGSIDLYLKPSGDVRWNLIAERDAPDAARRVMESYGGIPPDAEFRGAYTHYLTKYNATLGHDESITPMFTTISYSQDEINGLWIVGDSNFLMLNLGDFGEPLLIYKMWRTYSYSGDVSIIPFDSAVGKLQNGELLNNPTFINDKITIDMASPAYYAKTLPNNDTILEPAWLLFGDTESGTRVVFHVYARQFANFTATPTYGKIPLTVTFTDTSDTSPNRWLWNFGDGTNSTEQNPVHTYATAGTYNISLKAWNDLGSDTIEKLNYLTVRNLAPPVGNFTASPTSGNKPLTVIFNDSSTNNPTSWHWDFGDGTNSTAQNPVHTYPAQGDYSVSLNVTNDDGSNSLTKPDYIKVTDLPPTTISTIPTATITTTATTHVTSTVTTGQPTTRPTKEPLSPMTAFIGLAITGLAYTLCRKQ